MTEFNLQLPCSSVFTDSILPIIKYIIYREINVHKVEKMNYNSQYKGSKLQEEKFTLQKKTMHYIFQPSML